MRPLGSGLLERRQGAGHTPDAVALHGASIQASEMVKRCMQQGEAASGSAA
jgi:hypothetical protein